MVVFAQQSPDKPLKFSQADVPSASYLLSRELGIAVKCVRLRQCFARI